MGANIGNSKITRTPSTTDYSPLAVRDYSTTRILGTSSSSSEGVSTAVSSLPPLLDSKGNDLSAEACTDLLQGKRVAYYFSAGWCPMCTSFEPSLIQFRQAAKDSDKEIQFIYVPSDRSAEQALQRADALDMWSVPFGDQADNIKKEFHIWAGAESMKLGFGRRSGVPAIVVLNRETGNELAFVPAESQGVAALQSWPLDDEAGVW